MSQGSYVFGLIERVGFKKTQSMSTMAGTRLYVNYPTLATTLSTRHDHCRYNASCRHHTGIFKQQSYHP